MSNPLNNLSNRWPRTLQVSWVRVFALRVVAVVHSMITCGFDLQTAEYLRKAEQTFKRLT